MKIFLYIVLIIVVLLSGGGYYAYYIYDTTMQEFGIDGTNIEELEAFEKRLLEIKKEIEGLSDEEANIVMQRRIKEWKISRKTKKSKTTQSKLDEKTIVKPLIKKQSISKKSIEESNKLDLFEELLFAKKYDKALNLFDKIKNKSSDKELNNIVSYFLNKNKKNIVGRFLYSQILYLEESYLDSIKVLYDLNKKMLNKKMQVLVHEKIDLTNGVFMETLLEQKKMVHLLSFVKYAISQRYEKEYYTYVLGKLYFDLDQLKDATNILKKIKFDQLYGKQARMILYAISPPEKVIKKKIDKRPKVVIPKAVIRYSSGALGKRNGKMKVKKKTVEFEGSKRFEKSVKLTRHGTNFMIKVMINKGKVLNMLLDTGASSTVIYEKSMKNIKHSIIRNNVKVQTASSTIKAKVIKLKSIAVEDNIVYNIKALIVKTSAKNTSDGLLGMNFLENYDFYIDQKKAILYLTSIIK